MKVCLFERSILMSLSVKTFFGPLTMFLERLKTAFILASRTFGLKGLVI